MRRVSPADVQSHAIPMSIIELNVGNCQNCYKCIRDCSLKAIEFREHHAQIIENQCVLCGKCVLNCPQNAKYISSDVEAVQQALAAGKRVYASVAPSYVGWYDDYASLSGRLKALGFAGVEETAIGAKESSREYARLMDENQMQNIIVTACPSVVMLVERHYPELIAQLAPVPSPVMAHARLMKETYSSDIVVVFIGPCFAKKQEIRDPLAGGYVDYALTFDQLDSWFEAAHIAPTVTDAAPSGVKQPIMRYYPKPTGILQTIEFQEDAAYHPVAVDGMENCMELFNALREQDIKGLFIEANMCPGGCVGGPVLRGRNKLCLINETKLSARPQERDATPAPTASVETTHSRTFANRSISAKMPTEDEIRLILAKIGKTTKEQEINCGSCGYPTCRDKAIAVYQGKADINMCMPFFRERAESMSNTVIEYSPNGLVVLDDQLCVVDINPAASALFNAVKPECIGKPLPAFYGEVGFSEAHDAEKPITRKLELSGHNKVIEVTFLFIKQQGLFLTVVKDITQDELAEQQMEKMRHNTIEIAQNVIDKQMRVAQEIASLLGETTAETKVALSNLKRSMEEPSE